MWLILFIILLIILVILYYSDADRYFCMDYSQFKTLDKEYKYKKS